MKGNWPNLAMNGKTSQYLYPMYWSWILPNLSNSENLENDHQERESAEADVRRREKRLNIYLFIKLKLCVSKVTYRWRWLFFSKRENLHEYFLKTFKCISLKHAHMLIMNVIFKVLNIIYVKWDSNAFCLMKFPFINLLIGQDTRQRCSDQQTKHEDGRRERNQVGVIAY